MRKLLVTAAVSGVLGAVMALSLAPTTAQEAEPEQRAQVGAVIDVSPITKEIARLRAELTALRAAVADADGLRGDVAKATAALKDVQGQIKELNDGFKAYAAATQPVIQALKPARRWKYSVLRTRSENVVSRYGREGWELVTASQDWLFFRKPLAEGDEEK